MVSWEKLCKLFPKLFGQSQTIPLAIQLVPAGVLYKPKLKK